MAFPSGKLVGVLVWSFVLGVLVGTAFGLKCYSCEAEECENGGGEAVDCGQESSVCVHYVDVTGRALDKGQGYVYKRQCGASFQGGEPRCKQVTVNFDICICATDFCNGEGEPVTKAPTILRPPPTEEPNEIDVDDAGTDTEKEPPGGGTD